METPEGVDEATAAGREVRPAGLRAARSGWVEGAVQLAVAAACWGVLAVAAGLEASPEGLGTHEQLGLRPCTFHQVTGVPCPSCGMTTSFALMAHGHVVSALVVHPFGALLFVLVLAAALVVTASLLSRRSLKVKLYSERAPLAIYGLILLWLAGWGFKMVYGAVTGGYGY